MTQANQTPASDDSTIRASLLDLDMVRTLHPIPMVARELRTIASATTLNGLDQISNSWNADGSNFSVLGDEDQETLANAWVRREKLVRLSVAWCSIWGSLAKLTPSVQTTPEVIASIESALAETAHTVTDDQTTGSMADGARRGVGFSTPQGYLTALQRGGLQAHTRAEYLATVRAAGLATDDTFPPANDVTHSTQASPLLTGATHAGDGNQTLMASIQVARRRVRMADLNSPEARAEAIMVARQNGAKLAGYDGQVTDPNGTDIGSIVSFGRLANSVRDPLTGRKRQTLTAWGDVEAVRVALGLPVNAFGRAPGSVGILGDATEILNHGGYVARRIKAAAIPSFEDPAIMIPVRSAWKIGYFDSKADSDSMGKREATIALVKDGDGVKIICDAPEHSGAAAVIADYERRIAGTMIESEDLVGRVEAAFRRVCGARMTDLGCYVSPAMSDRAVALANAIRPLMGRNVYCYAHTHKESLSAALTDSVVREIESLESAIAKPTYQASAATITKIESCKESCRALAGFLGDGVKAYQERLAALDAKVTEGLNSTTQRALNIEMD